MFKTSLNVVKIQVNLKKSLPKYLLFRSNTLCKMQNALQASATTHFKTGLHTDTGYPVQNPNLFLK